jgi:hypothetical protein
MKQDRFLTGILVGIAILIVAALLVFFTRQNQQLYIADNTPDAVVHNYTLAVLNKDYPKAYGYLSDLANKPTLAEFSQSFLIGKLDPANAGIKIGKVEITGDHAGVAVSMVYQPNDPFSTGYSNAGSAELIQQNGIWKIASMPTYNLWDSIWYQAPPKP